MDREQYLAHARLEARHWWFTARREILRSLLHRAVPPHAGHAIVDLGCGTGGNAAALADEYTVLGIDPSAEAIALARTHHPGVRFERRDALEGVAAHLARGGGLLMTDVLEHVADDRALLDAAVTAVPPGGSLLLTVPADPSLWSGHDTAFGHHRRYTLDRFRQLWQDAPVEERLLSPFNSRLRPVIATIRRLRRGGSGSDLALPAGPFNAMLHAIFAGERRALVAAIDTGTSPYRRGVSLVALLRRR